MRVWAKIREWIPPAEEEKDDGQPGDLSMKNKKHLLDLNAEPPNEEDEKYTERELCLRYWLRVVYAQSEELYEIQWQEMKSKFHKNYPKLFEYLEAYWLIYKERFIAALTDDHKHFGNTSTNRAESSHSAVKDAFNFHSCKSFLSLWTLLHNSWPTSYATIKMSFEHSLVKVKHIHRIKLFDSLRGHVSTTALDILNKELGKVEKVNSDGSNCAHQLRRAFGLPCAHEIKIVLETRQQKMLFLHEIHPFWKKLNATPTKIDIGDLEIHEEFAILVEVYKKAGPERKAYMLRQMREIGRPETTSLEVPPLPGKTTKKKRNKRKRTSTMSAKRTPSHFEFPSKNSYASTQLNVDSPSQTLVPSIRAKRTVLRAPSLTTPQRGCGRGRGSGPPLDPPMPYEDVDSEDDFEDRDIVELGRKFDKVAAALNKRDNPPVSVPRDMPLVENSPFMEVVPKEFKRCVEGIIDVRGDGNCGYRAIAVGLGWSEDDWKMVRSDMITDVEQHKDIYVPLFGKDYYDSFIHAMTYFDTAPAPKSKWLVMPWMGYVVASTYNCVFLCLSMGQRLTFLPLHSPPPKLGGVYKEVAILHNINHYISLLLKPLSPIPAAGRAWEKNRKKEAVGWDIYIRPRVNDYEKLFGPVDVMQEWLQLPLTDDEKLD